MTKCCRLDTNTKVGVFPNETLLEALSRVLGENDGVPQDVKVRLSVEGLVCNVKVVGKTRIPGELERPVCKFHGREIEVVTDKTTVRIRISEA